MPDPMIWYMIVAIGATTAALVVVFNKYANFIEKENKRIWKLYETETGTLRKRVLCLEAQVKKLLDKFLGAGDAE